MTAHLSPLGDCLSQDMRTDAIRRTDEEVFATIRLYGRGMTRRNIGVGKTPKPFTGYRLRAGQFVYSRIDARHGAFALVPDWLNGAVVSKDFPRFDVDDKVADQRYVLHIVKSADFYRRIQDLSVGATNRQRIKEEVLLGLKIPLPPLPEQRRIAAILDHAETLRAKRLKAVAVFAELAGSLFRERFGDPRSNPQGYPVAALKTLVRQGDKINYGVVQPGGSVEGGVPLIRAGDLEGGQIDQSALRTISDEVDKRHKRSRLRGDELLISCVGSIGTVAPASPEVAGYNIARAVARVPLGPSVDRDYIAAWLRTEAVQDYFRAELRTVAQPTLNIKQIELLDVILPPLKEQRAFATELSKLAAIRASMSSDCLGLDTLFSSLQGRAFRGEL